MDALRSPILRLFLLFLSSVSVSSLPNIFLLLIDDLGWNDMSLHGGCDFDTPILDALAQEGLELSNYYAQHLCTPSRHALMTGRYPITDAMQEHVIGIAQPYGMPDDLTTLPEMLQRVGYHTHMIGKWHLGFCYLDYTPTHRGFDTFYGYYGDGVDYFTKHKHENGFGGSDFRNGTAADPNEGYSTYLFANETLRLLKQYAEEDNSDPFFLYLSSQAVHTTWTAPDEYLDYFAERITSPERSKLAAVATVLDETVGQIVDYMKSNNLWDNTLFIVSSDNGGSVHQGASNFPLRGGKQTLWEGGVKVPAFVTGGILADDRRGESMDALMHISDWFPTIADLAGIEYKHELDGLSQLNNIMNGESDIYEPRDTVVHNMLPTCHVPMLEGAVSRNQLCGALRWRNWKIISGKEARTGGNETDCESLWCPPVDGVYVDSMTVQCSPEGNYNYPAADFALDCPYNGYPCLFDIESDPCEYIDLREKEPEIYRFMYNKLVQYNQTQKTPTVYSLYPDDYAGSNPALFDGWWSPWKEIESETPDEKPESPPQDVLVNVVVKEVEKKKTSVWKGEIVTIWNVVFLIVAGVIVLTLNRFWNRHRRKYEKITDQTVCEHNVQIAW